MQTPPLTIQHAFYATYWSTIQLISLILFIDAPRLSPRSTKYRGHGKELMRSDTPLLLHHAKKSMNLKFKIILIITCIIYFLRSGTCIELISSVLECIYLGESLLFKLTYLRFNSSLIKISKQIFIDMKQNLVCVCTNTCNID